MDCASTLFPLRSLSARKPPTVKRPKKMDEMFSAPYRPMAAIMSQIILVSFSLSPPRLLLDKVVRRVKEISDVSIWFKYLWVALS